MLSMYAYWAYAIGLVLILTMGVGYAEAEEQSSLDKSPKHHLLFSPRNIGLGVLVIGFVLFSMFL